LNLQPATSRPSAPSTPPVLELGRLTILPNLEDTLEGATTAPGTPGGAIPRLPAEERPRFHPLAEIGTGALGQVVAARDLDIGRRVAIKRLRSDRRSEATFLRFVQEVRTAGQLDHPNIVPIHDVGREEDGSYYIVMKYVDGETLEALLDRLKSGDPETHRQWGFERRVEVFMQVLQAVRFAHDRGVLHRDLKPANIMIGSHGEVQLLDWGIAKRRTQSEVSALAETWIGAEVASPAETRAGALIGTPRYMAPEQARGEPADVRSETYTLSLILYELLTLQHPRDAYERIDELLNAAQKLPVPHFGKLPVHPAQGRVPVELGWFVMDGLSLDPEQRHPDVARMIELLQRRTEGEFAIRCPATWKKSMALKAVHTVDRHPLWSWLIVILPLLGALVSVVALAGSVAVLLSSVALVLFS
jgi:serine/threonine protein kinase